MEMRRAVVLLVLLLLPLAVAQEIKIVEYKIDGTMKITVDEVGNAKVTEVWKFTPNLYLQMKQAYPTTYMLKREFENKRSDTEYRNMKIEWDDSNNQIKATYVMLGAAVNKGSYWELKLGEGDLTLSTQTGNTVVLTAVQPLFGGQGRLVETITVVLPEKAKNIRFENNVIRYELPYKESGKNPVFLALAGISIVGLVALNVPLKREKK
ncbi:hypothetical protein VFC49_06060 [Thermococcus sp. SY098]|uniref:hypothetical protein n=1 Tax=Thermococcus sp. SY098 TaxID=3111325 RepID=UPI002D7697B0|nr:hypothetical protein [Thermococcus sp. SY098]WRS51667.1 hypothetical protein VFC49_06060 [Thermococcus sp. SY098]